MKNFWMKIILSAFLLLPFPTLAQDIPEEESPIQVNSEWILPAEHPPTNNILFLIDGSGSMDGEKANIAINFALNIAGAPTDDLQIAIVTFGNSVRRWEGTEDIDPQTGQLISLPGWAAMPSLENLEHARAWLSENLDSGSTYLNPGLHHSFASCGGSKDPLGLYSQTINALTIIILTDGAFTDSMDVSVEGPGILDTLSSGQQNRADAELNEAIIGVIGINVQGFADSDMQRLAGSLGYLSLTFIEEE